MVSARDFVYVSKKGYKGKAFVMGGRSVEFAEAPSSGKIVRAVNGSGCQMVTPTEDPNTVEFCWLMDCDYKVTHIICMLGRILRIKLYKVTDMSKFIQSDTLK